MEKRSNRLSAARAEILMLLEKIETVTFRIIRQIAIAKASLAATDLVEILLVQFALENHTYCGQHYRSM